MKLNEAMDGAAMLGDKLTCAWGPKCKERPDTAIHMHGQVGRHLYFICPTHGRELWEKMNYMQKGSATIHQVSHALVTTNTDNPAKAGRKRKSTPSTSAE